MNTETLVPLISFAVVALFTPGPNNLMLMSSGANFGFKKTVPHMIGVALGFSIMFVLVGLGLMNIFSALPWTYNILKAVSICYLLFLAYKIATASTDLNGVKIDSKPFTFLQALLFQWVNPKAWTIALSAITLYTENNSISSALFVSLVFFISGIPSVSTWTLVGCQLQRIQLTCKQLKAFNITMALLLITSVV